MFSFTKDKQFLLSSKLRDLRTSTFLSNTKSYLSKEYYKIIDEYKQDLKQVQKLVDECGNGNVYDTKGIPASIDN